MGKKPETGFRQLSASLARQHSVKFLFQPVQISDIVCCIGELLFSQVRRAPIRALLLLRKVDIQEFFDQIFEAVLIGIRSHQLRGRSRAVHGRGGNPEISSHRGDIEPSEVKQLQHVGIGQEPLEIGSRIRPRLELYGMAGVVPRG